MAAVWGATVGPTDLGALRPRTCWLQSEGLQSRGLQSGALQSVRPIWEPLVHSLVKKRHTGPFNVAVL